MRDVKRVAFLIDEPRDCWEGLRSTLGLLVENMWASAFFIDCDIELPAGKSREDFEENLEMLADLEGEAFSNVAANAERFQGVAYATIEEMAEKIKTFQLVVPF